MCLHLFLNVLLTVTVLSGVLKATLCIILCDSGVFEIVLKAFDVVCRQNEIILVKISAVCVAFNTVICGGWYWCVLMPAMVHFGGSSQGVQKLLFSCFQGLHQYQYLGVKKN